MAGAPALVILVADEQFRRGVEGALTSVVFDVRSVGADDGLSLRRLWDTHGKQPTTVRSDGRSLSVGGLMPFRILVGDVDRRTRGIVDFTASLICAARGAGPLQASFLVLLILHAAQRRKTSDTEGGTGSRVAAVLLLLLESGAVYCVLWVLDILSNTFYWDWTHKVWVGLPESFRIVDELFYLFAGIYPTFVVVVVALQQQKDTVRRTKGQSSLLESLCLVPDNGHVARPEGGTYRPVGDFASTGSTETDFSDEIELDYRSHENGRGEVA
ncbi:hypothetical protein GGG16DRAFT_113948 [Schizophyllum commune]